MKETANVIKTTGKIAVLEILKRPECDGCGICAFREGKSKVKVKALNTACAKAGDTVIVKAEKDHRAFASFIVYIVPVLLAGIGVLIGWFALASELWAAMLCLAGFILGFVLVVIADRLAAKSRGFGMEVVEIINTTKEEEKENGERT